MDVSELGITRTRPSVQVSYLLRYGIDLSGIDVTRLLSSLSDHQLLRSDGYLRSIFHANLKEMLSHQVRDLPALPNPLDSTNNDFSKYRVKDRDTQPCRRAYSSRPG